MHTDPHLAPEWPRSALVIVDTQQDTIDEEAFKIRGTSLVVPAMARLAKAFRVAGLPVIHVVRIYQPDGSDADLCRRTQLARGAKILLAGTPGRNPMPELLPDPGLDLDDETLYAGEMQELGPQEWAMYKPRWGSFYQTPLEEFLRGLDVSTVVFAGANFPNCPRSSIFQASERDFRVVAISDALSGLYQRGEEELLAIGVSWLTADQCIAELDNLNRE